MTCATGGGNGPSLDRAVRPPPSSIIAAARSMFRLFPECPSGSCSEADEDETECVSSEDEKDGLLLISPRSDRCSLCIMRRRAMVSVAGGRWGGSYQFVNVAVRRVLRWEEACARLDVMVLPRGARVARSLVGWLACRADRPPNVVRLDSSSVRVSLPHKNVYRKHDRGHPRSCRECPVYPILPAIGVAGTLNPKKQESDGKSQRLSHQISPGLCSPAPGCHR